MNDDGCPTCSSKNYGNVKMEKNGEGVVAWKKQCYNCKKFWHDSDF